MLRDVLLSLSLTVSLFVQDPTTFTRHHNTLTADNGSVLRCLYYPPVTPDMGNYLSYLFICFAVLLVNKVLYPVGRPTKSVNTEIYFVATIVSAELGLVPLSSTVAQILSSD